MKKKSRNKAKSVKKQDKSEIKNYILPAVKSIALFLIFLLISAFLCYKIDLQEKYYYLITLAVCSITCFFGGLFLSKKLRKRGIICGLIGSAPVCLVSVITSLITSNFNIGFKLIAAVAIMLFCGAVGGIFAVNMRR